MTTYTQAQWAEETMRADSDTRFLMFRDLKLGVHSITPTAEAPPKQYAGDCKEIARSTWNKLVATSTPKDRKVLFDAMERGKLRIIND